MAAAAECVRPTKLEETYQGNGNPRKVVWHRLCDRPRLYHCHDFLTKEECDAIIGLAQAAAPRSLANAGPAKLRVELDSDPGHSREPDETAVLRRIEERVVALSGVSFHGAELPWAVHFTPAIIAEEAPTTSAASLDSSTRRTEMQPSSAGAPKDQRARPAHGRSTGQERQSARSTNSSMSSHQPPVVVRRTSRPRGAETPVAVSESPPEAQPARMSLGLHVDTNNCRERRWLTFIIYLHTTLPWFGGHTVFPLASRRGTREPRGGKLSQLRASAELLLASGIHHTGQAGNPCLGPEVRSAAGHLLAHAEEIAKFAASPPGGEEFPVPEVFWAPGAPGVAVSPLRGSCVAFFTRSGVANGAIDARSWHAGAAVLANEKECVDKSLTQDSVVGKWTLQKFREVPPEDAETRSSMESFARQHEDLRPCCVDNVQFEVACDEEQMFGG